MKKLIYRHILLGLKNKALPFLMLMFLLITAGFTSANADDKTYIFSDDNSQFEASALKYYIDSSSSLDVSQIVDKFQNKEFTTCSSTKPNLGFVKDEVWFSLKMTNKSSNPSLILEVDFANYNEIELYVLNSSYQLIELQKQGVYNLNQSSGYYHRCPIFELQTKPDSVYNLLFRIKNEAPVLFPLEIHTSNGFLNKEKNRRELSYLLFGLMLATVLFNLIFFFITKNKSYIFLALHLLCSLGNFIFYLGYGYEYFHYLNPKLLLLLKFDFYALSALFHILFIIYYLALNKKGFSRNIAIISTVFYSIFFIITMSGMLPVLFISQIAIYTYVLSVVINLTISIIHIIKRNRNAVYYFSAFSIHFIASIVFMLTTDGILPYNVFNTNIQIFAAVIFGILLSIGLTEQFAFNNALSASNQQLEKDKDTLIKEVEERKKIEKQLIESENKFRMLIELLPHPLILTDLETGLILEANKALCDVSGFSKDELLGNPTTKIGFWEYEDRNAFMDELVKKEKLTGKQMKMQIAQKKMLPVLLYSEIITINSQLRILTLIVDISEMKKNEETLKNTSEKLEITNKTKDKFFSIIAHDLQNPLNVMLAYSKETLSYFKSHNYDKAEQYSLILNSITGNTSNLIQNLLSWARVQTGLISYNQEDIRVLSLVENEIHVSKPYFDSKNINIGYQCPSELIINGDINMIRTILRNLISNAYKFTNAGGNVFISVMQDNNFNIIKVSDDGIGISDRLKNRLFRIDELTHKAGTENELGTGLGLILCSEFITLHNGHIDVESSVGKGSIFTVKWPIKEKNNFKSD